jgi:hypothetical protein
MEFRRINISKIQSSNQKKNPTMKGKVRGPLLVAAFNCMRQSALREWAGIVRLAGKTAEFNPFVQTPVRVPGDRGLKMLSKGQGHFSADYIQYFFERALPSTVSTDGI